MFDRERKLMGKIFYIMGKSATGKDTIFKEVLKNKKLHLKNVILYTSRPIRAKEKDGVEYHFVDESRLLDLQNAGKVIEMRSYDTIHGIWSYATVDDGQFDLGNENFLAIGTLESFEKMKAYFGENKVVPVYIEVADDNRLERALRRERKQEQPKYEELCRRFLADAQDFSEENITKAGISKRFLNNKDREACVNEVVDYIYGIIN